MAVGSALCLYENGFRPEMATGSSGGAAAIISFAPWDKETMRSTRKTWLGLTPGKIFKMNWADDAFLFSLIAVPALHLLPSFASSERDKKIERGIKAALSFALFAGSLKAVFRQPSFFSSAPLRKLLEKNLDPKKIFSDDAIKLAIIAAKQHSGERSIYTNFLEGDKGNTKKLILGALASSAIVPALEPQEGEIDGIFAQGDFLGIDLIERYVNVEKILVFRFYELPLWQEPHGALEKQDNANELIVRDRIDSIIRELPEETLKKIIPVMLDEAPRKIDLHDFTKADLCYLLEKGYEATEKVLPKLLR